MTQPSKELEQQLGYLATELLAIEPDRWHVWGAPMTPNEYLLTGNGMLEIIEAMRERGFTVNAYAEPDAVRQFVFGCDIAAGEDPPIDVPAKKLPEAVARAAYAALQEQAE